MKSVLISGASIAGPTLAYWLDRQGFAVTLVERAPVPRAGGQAIDVRGPALDVIEWMGLLDGLHAHRTRMTGMSAVGDDGEELWRSEEMTYSGGSFDSSDVEILRDELSTLIMDRLPDCVERLYGDSITGITEDAEGVAVRFDKAPARRFDLVVGADGIQSNVRRLIFGDEATVVPLGYGIAIFTTPNLIGLHDWQIQYEVGEIGALVYSVRANSELRICFTFPATLDDEQRGDIVAQRAMVRKRTAVMGWEIPRFLDMMEAAPDFYFGTMAQIKMPHWTRGRVALVGDAGYCASPFSGQGTSLAIIGAYVLAQSLGRTADHRDAFAAYEAKMRPFVIKNQAIVEHSKTADLADEQQRAALLAIVDEAKMAITLDADI